MGLRITVDRQALTAALGIVARSAATRTTLPVLAGVHLEAADSTLRLTCTDLEQSISLSIPATTFGGGVACPPAKLLHELAGSVGGDKINLDGEKPGKLSIRSGSYAGEMTACNTDDWPQPEDCESGVQVSLGPRELREALAQVLFAVALDDSRPALAGVLFEFQGDRLTLAAADGFRLAVRSLAVEYSGDAARVIVPRRACAALARLLAGAGSLTVRLPGPERGTVTFELGGVTLRTRQIEGAFPAYQQIIPTGATHQATCAALDLAAAVRAARLFGREGDDIVRLRLRGDGIWVSARGDAGVSEDEVPATVEGKSLEVALKGEYLLDALGALGGQVQLEVTGKARPVLLRSAEGEGSVQVIMPMHVRGEA